MPGPGKGLQAGWHVGALRLLGHRLRACDEPTMPATLEAITPANRNAPFSAATSAKIQRDFSRKCLSAKYFLQSGHCKYIMLTRVNLGQRDRRIQRA